MKNDNIIDDEEQPNTISTIFWGGVLAGTLDGMAAALYLHDNLGLNAGQVMQFVASALFGQASFQAGYLTVFAGFVIHYLIAFGFSAIYYYSYPVVSAIRQWPVVLGLCYGLGVWLVVNVLLLPLTRISLPPFEINSALIVMFWHMLLVGLPIAFIVNIHYHAVSQE